MYILLGRREWEEGGEGSCRTPGKAAYLASQLLFHTPLCAGEYIRNFINYSYYWSHVPSSVNTINYQTHAAVISTLFSGVGISRPDLEEYKTM